jgi:hypothetical protein
MTPAERRAFMPARKRDEKREQAQKDKELAKCQMEFEAFYDQLQVAWYRGWACREQWAEMLLYWLVRTLDALDKSPAEIAEYGARLVQAFEEE